LISARGKTFLKRERLEMKYLISLLLIVVAALFFSCEGTWEPTDAYDAPSDLPAWFVDDLADGFIDQENALRILEDPELRLYMAQMSPLRSEGDRPLLGPSGYPPTCLSRQAKFTRNTMDDVDWYPGGVDQYPMLKVREYWADDSDWSQVSFINQCWSDTTYVVTFGVDTLYVIDGLGTKHDPYCGGTTPYTANWFALLKGYDEYYTFQMYNSYHVARDDLGAYAHWNELFEDQFGWEWYGYVGSHAVFYYPAGRTRVLEVNVSMAKHVYMWHSWYDYDDDCDVDRDDLAELSAEFFPDNIPRSEMSNFAWVFEGSGCDTTCVGMHCD